MDKESPESRPRRLDINPRLTRNIQPIEPVEEGRPVKVYRIRYNAVGPALMGGQPTLSGTLEAWDEYFMDKLGFDEGEERK